MTIRRPHAAWAQCPGCWFWKFGICGLCGDCRKALDLPGGRLQP